MTEKLKTLLALAEVFSEGESTEKAPTPITTFAIGDKVLVRSNRAGVFFGTLAHREGQEAIMTNVRRLWYWDGAFTLSGVANHGVNSNSKLSETESEKLLTDVIEVIRCKPEAAKQIEEMEAHRA